MSLTHTYAGKSGYRTGYGSGPHTLLVAAPCLVAESQEPELALFDTAAEWCMLPPDVAEALEVTEESGDPLIRMSTRFGTFSGHLTRLPIHFVPDEGESLTIEATWFGSPDWPGPLVVGWRGCLERMRFALHPDEEALYFRPL